MSARENAHFSEGSCPLRADRSRVPAAELPHSVADGFDPKRVMTLDTSIDHIFAVQNDGYSFEVLDTVPIRGEIPVPGGTVGFSDHTGHLSTLRIRSTG